MNNVEVNLATAEENVVIQAGNCRLTLLPQLGGKIASLLVAGHELLQTPLNPYAPRNQTMDFSESDASGWDECLPSVSACSIQTEAGIATIPDHGDLWRVPWQILDQTNDSATMRVKCFSLPLQLTRTLLLSETASGWDLQILYSLTNMGAFRVPWSWSAHPLFAADAGDTIRLPNSVKTVRLEGSSGNRLGSKGNTQTWPLAALRDGSKTDLSTAAAEDSGYGDKLFAGPLNDGWCQFDRSRIGLTIRISFDPALTPYLGLWLCYGGWPDAPGPKQVCVAIEPATAPADSLAENGPWSRSLDVGETYNWTMAVTIDRQHEPID